MDVPRRQPSGEPPVSEDQTSDAKGSVRDCSSDLPPDPIREGTHENAFGREYESLPHHPIHIINRLLSLPPVMGLRDLIRTVWWRKKNPFHRLMWQAVWGRRPILHLALTILAISVFVVGSILLISPVYRWLTSPPPTATSGLSSTLGVLLDVLFPFFLTYPSLYFAVLFAWRIRRSLGLTIVDSELTAAPNWRPFVFRAVGVQLCVAALLLVLLGEVGSRAYRLLDWPTRATLQGSGNPLLGYVLFVAGLGSNQTLSFSSLIWHVLGWLWEWINVWLSLALYLIVLLRAKTLSRLTGGMLAVSYGLLVFELAFGQLVVWIAGWLMASPLGPTVGIQFERWVSFIGYPLIIGWLWQLAYRRFCREEPVSRSES